MKTGSRRIIALALGLCTLTVPASAAASFSDVPASHWGHSYITKAASNGLVSGVGEGRYAPEETLSNAQFVTMVANLFYSTQVKAQGTSGDWWRPYMNVAYAYGLLNGTAAGQQYAAAGRWTDQAVNGQISRYDMAQIMYNLSTAQQWETPDAMSLVLSQLLIKDWSSIPTNYQMPVAYCYAKGLLSGDQNGSFSGSTNTTRAQAAVVLCSLNDVKTKLTAPTYSNSNRLSNGRTDTEENVADLLESLRASYPNYGQWNVTTAYTSQRLGTGSGSRGFAYMLSDKIFGGMPARAIDDPADLRLGDVISLKGGSQYGVVCQADKTTFTYVSCDASGWISWKNSMYREDLGRNDTVYTRYLTMPEPDDVLSNGKEATRANVEDLLDGLMDKRTYQDGKKWDLDSEYRSSVLGTASGDRGFAYQLSDAVFGELSYERVENAKDLRVGDLIHDRSGRGLYGIVVSVDYKNERYTYVSVESTSTSDRISWSLTGRFDDLNLRNTYTRYPDGSDYDYSGSKSSTLANGKAATESNAAKLLDSVLNSNYKGYYSDQVWTMDSRYTGSSAFRGARDDEGFAYFISDKVFGDLDAWKVSRAKNLRVGDVIYDGSRDLYGVVESIDTKTETCSYYTVRNSGALRNPSCDFDSIEAMYTRYPD